MELFRRQYLKPKKNVSKRNIYVKQKLGMLSPIQLRFLEKSFQTSIFSPPQINEFVTPTKKYSHPSPPLIKTKAETKTTFPFQVSKCQRC